MNTSLVKNHDQIQGVSLNESQKPCKQQIGKVCDMNTNAAIHWDFLFWSIFGQVPSSYLKMQWLFYRYVFWSSLMHSRIGQSKVIFCYCLLETSEPEGIFLRNKWMFCIKEFCPNIDEQNPSKWKIGKIIFRLLHFTFKNSKGLFIKGGINQGARVKNFNRFLLWTAPNQTFSTYYVKVPLLLSFLHWQF